MGSVTDLKENKTLFVCCDCQSEILMIEYNHEYEMADLAMYQISTAYIFRMSLWQRLRYCWRIIWHGKPYADQMVLSNKQLLELKSFLSGLGLK